MRTERFRIAEPAAWCAFAALVLLSIRVPVSELGDTAVFGHVYLWGAEGSWNNVCGPNPFSGAPTGGPCSFVNGLEVAQRVGFAGLLVVALLGILRVRSRSAARTACAVLVALCAMAFAQTKILVPRWSDALLLWPSWIPTFVSFAIVLVLARHGQPSGGLGRDVS